MSLLDGLATTFNSALAGIMYDLTLVRTVQTSGNAWDASSGTQSSTTYTGKGLVELYSNYEIANSMAQATDRKILIMAASLTIEPKPDDVVTINGESFTLVGPGKSDPAKATWEFMGKRA